MWPKAYNVFYIISADIYSKANTSLDFKRQLTVGKNNKLEI